MLIQFFPRMHRRFSSLRLLGPILGGFAGWLHARGYPRVAVRRHLRAARRLERRWLRRGLCSLSAICRTDFQVCAPGHSHDDPDLAAVARVLKTYFEERGLLAGEPAPEAPLELTGYQQYLTALRGLAPGTIADHLATVSEFLQFIADKRPAISLGQLTPRELEAFVQQVAARVSRATLQHVVAHLRSFLRWLAAQGAVRKGLESQIDTPRVYRQEQLPRALRWDIRPYIFTTTDIARLLDAADRLVATSRSPLRRETFRLAIVLLYTSGLRRGELVRLTVGDYDPSDQTLLIRASKFHKSRRLPLSSHAQSELEAYLRTRRHRGFPTTADSALIWNRSRRGGRPYTGEAVRCEIDALLRAADIRTPTGARPRIHDIRHTFAVHALLRWYHRGVDPQAKLPFLSTYMGHVSPVSTAYYLPFVSALAEAASLRFLRTCGALVTGSPAGERP
jgi:integrase